MSVSEPAARLGPMVAVLPWTQDRPWEWNWEMHPIWWPVAALAAGILLLILFGWVLLHLVPVILAIVGAALGIRWLMKATRGSSHDPATAILRERYARGEISKEEFDAKLRDLGAPRET